MTSELMERMLDAGITNVKIKCQDAVGYLAVYRLVKNQQDRAKECWLMPSWSRSFFFIWGGGGGAKKTYHNLVRLLL